METILISWSVGGLLGLLALIAIGRTAHWTAATSEQLHSTNEMLQSLVGEAKEQNMLLKQLVSEAQRARKAS